MTDYLDHTQREARRGDEPAILALLPAVILANVRVLRVGRFFPGGDGSYAAVRVLLMWPRGEDAEYSTHTVVLRDDRGDAVPEWFATNGRYFPRDGYRGAAADLLTDDVDRFTQWLASRGLEIRDPGDGDQDARVITMTDAVAVYANHLREA